MSVVACILTAHDLRLVFLAALVCVGGSWVAMGLLKRARENFGFQQKGWLFLGAVAAGSSVWCTHFIAILAYQVPAPFTFDPILTFASLLLAISGIAVGFIVAGRKFRYSAIVGGGLSGVAISAMHYIGMLAYHVDGIVEWSIPYVVASVLLAIVLMAASVEAFGRMGLPCRRPIGLGLFVLAVVSLHFTGMAAMTVVPMVTGASLVGQETIEGMAVAVAGVAMIVAATGIASYLLDARSHQEMIDQLRMLALTDALTGLPNRTRLGDHLGYELSLAKDTQGKFAVIGIDLDRFKNVNDLYGHEAGDRVLKIIGQRLKNLLKDSEFVARVGGDEFFAAKRFGSLDDVHDFVLRINNCLAQPVHTDEFNIALGGSIGVALFPQDGDTVERLMANADLAMYRAKADIIRSVCYYEPDMDEVVRERQLLSLDLKRAIENEELELHYQVQTSVPTGDICGYEVLLRWKHPTRGHVPPAVFIPIAEETGSILAIGEWVLKTACHEAASWDAEHKIAVNLSAAQFTHTDLPALVHQTLFESGLAASRLELELTESTIIADKARTLHMLRQIKALGVTVAIDDFGIGYSSLDTLRCFPFDRIKLDRSFISEVIDNPQAKAIVRAVLALGRSLEISVLAEGVETQDQLLLLCNEGCDEVQGYLIGRPRRDPQTNIETSQLGPPQIATKTYESKELTTTA
ncbi:bifunctional diguanylate cyclase/phosphodiesterase [Hyphomicrobium sp. 99]|uniref:putative bifunctional diguanylate cyclase/phosphodiesterase n=1 Tax=Hyphomicrobium sp. 99 TaxID=1163419 RepID=UPI000695D79D|nr:bifunctional diguanylate cyclase/phosphodiesterase [Hyphomicrobium sp. 99]